MLKNNGFTKSLVGKVEIRELSKGLTPSPSQQCFMIREQVNSLAHLMDEIRAACTKLAFWAIYDPRDAKPFWLLREPKQGRARAKLFADDAGSY